MLRLQEVLSEPIESFCHSIALSRARPFLTGVCCKENASAALAPAALMRFSPAPAQNADYSLRGGALGVRYVV